MTAGLNLARASCAATSSEGSMSSSARSSWQAASREIGVAPAFANSGAVADSASGKKVAIRFTYFSSYFEIRFVRARRKFSSSAGNNHTGDHARDHTGKDNSG